MCVRKAGAIMAAGAGRKPLLQITVALKCFSNSSFAIVHMVIQHPSPPIDVKSAANISMASVKQTTVFTIA